MNTNKKVLVIDGFALIFRAFYAFIKNPLKTSNGRPTSAIFGFLRMMIKIIKTYSPDYLVVALDSPGDTFRHEMFHEYKANRPEPPDDLKLQIPLVIEMIDKLGLASLQKPGYEADDIIGTLCHNFRDKELDVYVVTGDKDILQLVGGNIIVLTTTKGISEVKEYDSETVKEKWGVYPERIIDLFALMGDSSDNIPGVKGVGPKSALALLQSYETLEGVYEKVDELTKKKLKENLIKNKDNAFLSKKLVTINRAVPMDYTLEDFSNTNIAQQEGIDFIKDFELHSVLKDDIFQTADNDNKITKLDIKVTTPSESVEIEPITVKVAPKGNYTAILNKKDFLDLIEEIKKAKLLSIDLETTSENPHLAEIIGIAFAIEPEKGYFLPVKLEANEDLFGSYFGKSVWESDLSNYDLDNNSIFHEIKQICEDPNIQKIGQNIKYDYMVLKRCQNIDIKPISFDVMLASYLLNPGRQSHGMDHLAQVFLQYPTVKYKDLVAKGQTLLDVNLNTVVNYAAEDADITLRLYDLLKPKIDASIFKDLYYDVELPLVSVLTRMELSGVEIDAKYLKTMSAEIKDRLGLLEKKIWSLAGEEFNINSTKQLAEILFNKLGLKPGKKNKTGYSTDVSVLEELADKHQVPSYLVEYRKLKKLKSGYLDSLPKLINNNSGRIHTSFNQTITQTGRLSSNNPNLQNIPIKEELGRAIRKGFVAKSNHVIMSADYSQIELRILAHITEDPKLISAYQHDRDIHSQTASLIFKKSLDDITPDERRIAKTINFSVIYGIGASALAKDLKITSKLAKEFIENYFVEYEGVKTYIDKQKKLAHEQGFVETLLNRIRYVPEIYSKNRRDISFGERLAVNTPIQGTSADLIKIAMVEIDKEIQQRNLKSIMTIQVHDELVFEVAAEELDIMKELVIHKMESVAKLSIPLKVSLAYGNNWEEAH